MRPIDSAFTIEQKLMEGIEAIEAGDCGVMNDHDWERLHDQLLERLGRNTPNTVTVHRVR